jgi:pimeloyl-ACP methyl ester carboxylesterase
VRDATAQAEQLAAVERGFRSLPDRYLGADPDFRASYRIRIGDLGRIWEVRVDGHAARVCNGTTRRRPDVSMSTDAATWLALREGEFSGIDAFRARRLAVRGNLDLAIAFEGMFRLANGRPPQLHIRDVGVGRYTISTLTMGRGEDVLLIHGLGGTRASMFDTAAELSRRYRVHAIDLPGFGSSGKPLLGRYNAGWFADILLALMDELGIDRAHLVGNSMGGRIAIEMGLRAPVRVRSLGLLSPAVAWIHRGFHPIVRLLRPEFGFVPHSFTRTMVANQVSDLFYDRDAIDPTVGDILVDEFRRIYQSAGARYAFLACARNIYLDRPFGNGGFYPRLAELRPPALFIWGSHDPLVPAAFGRHVAEWLPSAEQVTLQQCGHVPQVERAEETNALLSALFMRAEQQERERPALPRAATRRRNVA